LLWIPNPQVVERTEPTPKSTKREDWCARLSATKLGNRKEDVVQMRERIRNQKVAEASPLTERDLDGFLQEAFDNMPPPRRTRPLPSLSSSCISSLLRPHPLLLLSGRIQPIPQPAKRATTYGDGQRRAHETTYDSVAHSSHAPSLMPSQAPSALTSQAPSSTP